MKKQVKKNLKSLATKTQKLTKAQLKKVKGGYIVTEELIDA